jgi:hypothetical protein
MSSEHGGHDHPHLKCSGNWFGRTWLPSTSRRMLKMISIVTWAYTILLEKCCVHMPCSLKDENGWYTTDFYGALHKYWSSKSLLADCTPHCTLCRVEWQLHVCVVFQRPRTSFSNIMSIFVNPFEVEMGWISKQHAVWGGPFMMYTILHSVCCIYGCTPLTSLQQMVPSFTFPISHSKLPHVFLKTLYMPCSLIWALWVYLMGLQIMKLVRIPFSGHYCCFVCLRSKYSP